MANAGGAAKGAVTGASLGAGFGPWGALAGGVAGGVYGLFSDDGSDAKKAQAAADAAKIAQERKNAIALSNYRLNSKNQYDQLKNNEYASFAPYSQRLPPAYGQGMSGPQKSAVSLADTGVGAPDGSNAAGWDEKTVGSPGHTGQVVHHTGYNEYLNGTAKMPGTAYYTKDAVNGTKNGNGYAYDQHYAGTTVDANPGGIPQTVAPSFMPGSNVITPAPTAGTPAPGTQYKFFPGGR